MTLEIYETFANVCLAMTLNVGDKSLVETPRQCIDELIQCVEANSPQSIPLEDVAASCIGKRWWR